MIDFELRGTQKITKGERLAYYNEDESPGGLFSRI